MLPGPERGALDLRDHGRMAPDDRAGLDHAGIEDGVDDRSMAERLADVDLATIVEDRQPSRRAGAAR